MRSILRLKNMLIGGCLLLCLACLGCLLISKTFTIVIYIEDPITATAQDEDDQVGWESVNLEDNDIWKDHKDEIKNIQSVEFYVKIKNNDPSVIASGQVYVSEEKLPTPTVEAIKNNAILVLDGISVQPNEEKEIEREESVQYLKNIEKLMELIKGGTFYFYGSAYETPFSVTFSETAIIISFTAGP